LGHFALVHGNRNAARAVSAGDRTWEAGWLEAFCMAQANPRGSVLLIFAEDVFPEGFLGQTRFQAEAGRGEAFLLCPVDTAKQPLGRVRLDAVPSDGPFDREVLGAWISDRNRQNLRVPLAGASLSFDPIYPEPARLLPHKAPMVLLDEIVSVGEQRACSRISIRPGIPFRRNGEVSSLTGIEYFAQTVAALAGWERFREGGEPRLGFLISVRDFRCELPAFPDGTQLLVEVVHAWGDQELMRFDGRILDADTGSVLAQGVINVFGPDNPGSFLESE
jgi:predicted hotdog family 3-hydroxylacyl-ACP dehydratase